jgi:hypothetical protein
VPFLRKYFNKPKALYLFLMACNGGKTQMANKK